jgi:hypothetical protein
MSSPLCSSVCLQMADDGACGQSAETAAIHSKPTVGPGLSGGQRATIQIGKNIGASSVTIQAVLLRLCTLLELEFGK